MERSRWTSKLATVTALLTSGCAPVIYEYKGELDLPDVSVEVCRVSREFALNIPRRFTSSFILDRFATITRVTDIPVVLIASDDPDENRIVKLDPGTQLEIDSPTGLHAQIVVLEDGTIQAEGSCPRHRLIESDDLNAATSSSRIFQ